MKKSAGASAIFYLLVAIGFIIVFLAMPYPHYNTLNGSWFLGTSIANRAMGQEESVGLSLDELVVKVTRASVTSPLDISCTTNADCKQYLIVNQCTSYCGNRSDENENAVIQLNNQRVCDPALWARPRGDCGCVAGKCIGLR